MRRMFMHSSWAIAALVIGLLGGCAPTVKQTYEGTLAQSEIAIVESVGDVGFRIDRTTNNVRPAAYLERINGIQIYIKSIGYPLITKVLPGPATLEIYCTLPNGSADPNAPVERSGYGPIVTQFTYARLTITANLRAGGRYHLKCESVPGYRARAWLDEVRS